MRWRAFVTRALLVTAAAFAGVTGSVCAQPVTKDVAPNGGGWKSLSSLSAWRGYKMQSVPGEWTQLDAKTFGKEKSAEDLVTRDEYGDFELELEWKLSPGGNAGVFYHATEEGDKVYWTGPEYQLLDDARHADGKNPLTSAGADYGLYAPPPGITKPAGEWNTTRIVARGAHVEHWLNGKKVVEYDLWSPDWEAKVKASKFAEWPGYGRAKAGRLAIQGDHAGTLQIRNARIRSL